MQKQCKKNKNRIEKTAPLAIFFVILTSFGVTKQPAQKSIEICDKVKVRLYLTPLFSVFPRTYFSYSRISLTPSFLFLSLFVSLLSRSLHGRHAHKQKVLPETNKRQMTTNC